ncbi:MAG: hypothetical protein COB22_07865 [Cycloclasticus sp.]|nr:MAG: hypothetical protein COB22_07865 [Cycloclasticus sp.]
MWYRVLQAIETYFKGLAEFANVTIQLGDSGAIPEDTTLVLLRGPGKADDRSRNRRGEQTVFIECWVTSSVQNALESAADGYLQLADLEDITVNALRMFGHTPTVIADYHITAKLGQIENDNDAFRPHVGSRIPLTITYTKITP